MFLRQKLENAMVQLFLYCIGMASSGCHFTLIEDYSCYYVAVEIAEAFPLPSKKCYDQQN